MTESTKSRIRQKANQHTANIVQFDRIKSFIANKCESTMGKNLALALSPSNDTNFIRHRLNLIQEIVNTLNDSGQPDLTGLCDITDKIKLVKKEGMLSAESLWKINCDAMIMNKLARLARKGLQERPLLKEIISNLETIPDLSQKITDYIIHPGEIKENATPLLSDLRKNQQIINEKIQSKLENYLNSKTYSKYLQEQLITLRHGRFVLPVKVDYKKEISGVIHDRSATGATLFIEPLPVVDLNNQLRELQLSEKAEKERILRLLSQIVNVHAETLLLNIEILGELDFLVSVARMATHLKCNLPGYAQSEDLILKNAKHPLLILEEAKKDDFKAIPLNLELKSNKRALLITGPNMGGKTIALKTCGLLIYMANCGLPIPVDKGSHIPRVEAIFSDIGDEQSIDDSLSTFAAHVTRWKEAIAAANSTSLILLDELGTGTDPEEGTPLSRALIEEFVSRNSYLIVTTHLGGLKAFASELDNVDNGAMLFDEKHLEPLYQLRIGFPGRSWAFQISQRLGLSEDILNNARDLRGDSESSIDNLISKLENTIEANESIQRDLNYQKRKLEDKTKEIDSLISSNKGKESHLDELIRRYENDKLDMLERELSAEKKKIEKQFKRYKKKEKALNAAREHVKNRMDKIKQQQKKRRGPPRDLSKGDRVWLYRLQKHGKVLSPTDKRGYIVVQVDGVKVKIHSSVAMPPKDDEQLEKQKTKTVYTKKKVPIARDLRGMNFEQAWAIIDKWISEALVVGVDRLNIIHGKGTGVLRKKIRETIEKDKRIKKWEYPEIFEGGEGATIIYLK